MLYAALLSSLALAGSFDVTGSIGGAAPLGNLEFNHKSGILGALALGLNTGPSRIELAGDWIHLSGSQQPDYALENLKATASYHYAFINRVGWQLRAGAGVDLNHLYRLLPNARESGSALGGTLMLTYVRRFGRPLFQFQLFGSELLEFQRAAAGTTVTPALLLGVKLGAGYEFAGPR